MEIYGLEINTVNTAKTDSGEWLVELKLAAPIKLSTAQALDLGKALVDVARTPEMLHMPRRPDPTFCEEKL